MQPIIQELNISATEEPSGSSWSLPVLVLVGMPGGVVRALQITGQGITVLLCSHPVSQLYRFAAAHHCALAKGSRLWQTLVVAIRPSKLLPRYWEAASPAGGVTLGPVVHPLKRRLLHPLPDCHLHCGCSQPGSEPSPQILGQEGRNNNSYFPKHSSS